MATPNGTATPGTIADESVDPIDALAPGLSYDERASRAFAALEAGHEPHEIQRRLSSPKTPGGADTPEEANGQRRADKLEDNAAKEEPAGNSPAGETERPAESKGESEPPDEQLLVARRILQRDNWTDKMLGKMSREEIIEHAERRAEVQREIDSRITRPGQKPEQDRPGTQPETETAPAAGDDAEIIEAVREYDPETAEKLAARLKSVADRERAMQEESARSKLQTARTRLKSEYPEVDSDDGWEKVRAKAETLVRTGAYDDVDAVLDDAAQLVYGKERDHRTRDRLLTKSRSEIDGQVDASSEGGFDTAKPMDDDEIDDIRYELLSKGKTPEEVRSIVSKIPRKR